MELFSANIKKVLVFQETKLCTSQPKLPKD